MYEVCYFFTSLLIPHSAFSVFVTGGYALNVGSGVQSEEIYNIVRKCLFRGAATVYGCCTNRARYGTCKVRMVRTGLITGALLPAHSGDGFGYGIIDHSSHLAMCWLA
jgi:hypothetical protein